MAITIRNRAVGALNEAIARLFVARASNARVKDLYRRWFHFLESDQYTFMPDALLSQVYGSFAQEYVLLCKATGVTPEGVDPSVATLVVGDIDVAMGRAERATKALLKTTREVVEEAGKTVAWSIGPTAILIAVAALAIAYARR